MKKFEVTVEGRTYPVTLVSREGNSVAFEYNEHTYSVEVSPVLPEPPKDAFVPAGRIASGSASSGPAAGPGEIVAPMPGIIVSVQVKKGDAVEAGVPLLIIEAMKMENNIPSPLAGTVEEVLVKGGQEVEKGALLIKIKSS